MIRRIRWLILDTLVKLGYRKPVYSIVRRARIWRLMRDGRCIAAFFTRDGAKRALELFTTTGGNHEQ